MRRRKANNDEDDEDNGFKAWGGYMEAKKAKLVAQFNTATVNQVEKLSDVFKGIGIYVNGRTAPTADELKHLMAAHGGEYHTYQSARTTHIVASNLPNVKIKQLGNIPIVSPEWVTDSISEGKLLDYRKYLLYTNQSRTQPKLNFKRLDAGDQQDCKPKQTLTAADPRFLEEFYSNSRLHLISTLGAELKQMVTQMRENSDGRFLGREALIARMNRSPHIFPIPQTVMHIDMDCFFVSVGLRKRPELRDKPVAVTHAKASNAPLSRPGTDIEAERALFNKLWPDEKISDKGALGEHDSKSEIASCSYEARKRGVRNGMFLGAALKLCPDLKTIPYDFQEYREVSAILYQTIASYTLDIEAVSCDEMYVDISQILEETGLTVTEWATHIRKEITDATGCPCSAGFGENRLQARLATKKAKPNGQFHLRPEDVAEFMAEIPVGDIPGVGNATVIKLKKLGLKTCSDVQTAPLALLQSELGPKAGEILKEQASGIDKRPLNFHQERKSVSADVNYGIRFKTKEEALNFLQSLSQEVHKRLTETGMRARCLTLKLLIRAAGAPVETSKFLGCGICDSINKSTTSNAPISDASTIFKEAKMLFERLNPPCHELRGVGIQLTKLERLPPVSTALSNFLKQGTESKETNRGSSEKATIKPDEIKQHSEQNKKIPDRAVATKSTTSTSRRGRGGGRGKRKIITRTKSNELDKYFKCQPSNTKNLEEQCKANNIDLDVFNALPEDLKKEVIRQYNLESAVVVAKPIKPSEPKKPVDKPQSQQQKSKSIFSKLTYEQLKDAIRTWLRSTIRPEDFDIHVLGEYFKELAVDRKIEVLHPLLNFLYRSLTEMNCGKWHKAYFTILNMAQEGMVARYGNTLLVGRSFPCCDS